jgi:ATP-dependent DNA ligase
MRLRSRNDKNFVGKYPLIARAFAGLPDETVVDGEIVALDKDGRPSFNLLQNAGTSTQPIFFYAFDVPILAGRDLMHEPLEARRTLLRTEVLSRLADPSASTFRKKRFARFQGMDPSRCGCSPFRILRHGITRLPHVLG